MKKINIFMSRLKYGGMELSLLNFINYTEIARDNEVHLYLIYCCNNELLEKIDNRVKIHLLCKSKWNLTNKLKTGFKLLLMLIFPKKSDISICYSNHQKILSTLTRKSSKKSILFVHSDLNRYEEEQEQKKIKNKIKFDKFSKIVCVSEVVKGSIEKLYNKNIRKKCVVISNYVDGKRIINLAEEKSELDINYEIPTFINIANHVEKYKNINLIINTAYKLKKENYNFQILLIGSGEDTEHYKEMIKQYELEKYVYLLGSKSNPYPYLKQSKALLFTSKYEGYGMVLDEARVLKVPIITTGSGASKTICKDGYGIITKDLYKDMKTIIKDSKKNQKDFDFDSHNNEITNEYQKLLKYI